METPRQPAVKRAAHAGLYDEGVTGSSSGQARAATADQVTIQDVARAAGVGRQTVSNVLNDSGRVGEAARARVLEAVAALGYHPNHGARSLRSRRTGQIAYVLPPALLVPTNYIMQRFLQALAAASGHQRYNMVVVVPDGDPRDEMRRLIASRSVDAFLLSDLQADDPRVALLAEAGVPFACFGRTAPGLPQHWVDIDNLAAVSTAVEHLLGRGFTRIAFAGYQSGNRWDYERAAGFQVGLARHGASALPSDMLLVTEDNARSQIRSLLSGTHHGSHPVGGPDGGPDDRSDSGPDGRPQAIVTGSDRLAVMIYGMAAELGLRIGRDLAVTGFDGSIPSDLLHPTLTSVSIPVEHIAERVVAQALRQVSGAGNGASGEVVEVSLRVGDSTGGDRGGHRD